MTSFQKKFDFVKIFCELYDKINSPKCFHELDKNIRGKIWELYTKNENDFQLFLEEVCKELYLTKEEHELYIQEEQNIFSQEERKCIFCKSNYKWTMEAFVTITDMKTKKDRTDDLCYNCIHTHSNHITCSKCNYETYADPYEEIGVQQDGETFTYTCFACICKERCKKCIPKNIECKCHDFIRFEKLKHIQQRET